MKRLLLLGLFAAVAASLAVGTLPRKPSAPAILTPVGAAEAAPTRGLDALVRTDPPRPVPALAFVDADGTRHSLREFAGRAVLLNVWATWCAPCVAELPSLAALAPRAKAAGIDVLPLSVDRGGTVRVRAFFASHGIDGLPVWNDADDAAGQALGLRGVPTTLLIDRQGREVARLEGAADWNADAALGALQKLVE